MATYTYVEIANMHLMFGHIYSNDNEAHSLFQEHFLHCQILDQKPFLPFPDDLGNTVCNAVK
jgi:hypothetical protein